MISCGLIRRSIGLTLGLTTRMASCNLHLTAKTGANFILILK